MSELPPEVLGRMGPLLCWVEGAEGLRLPQVWIADRIPPHVREQAWLVREFPTYSYDNVDDIVGLTRRRAHHAPSETSESRRRARAVAPPIGYDLMAEFDRLGKRYFRWQGNELAVREHRMVELHELALRFPVRHLIRHCHARAVLDGSLRPGRALSLPDSPGELPTTSRSLRAVVERGVSEGHLHLWGVLSGDEGWADHLLRHLTPGTLQGFRPQEERLLILGRVAVRLLAFALLAVHVGPAGGLPFRIIPHLDQLYHAGTRVAEKRVRHGLRKAFRLELRKLTRQWLSAPKEDVDWLLHLLDSTTSSLRDFNRRPYEMVRQRVALLDRLHFAVQLQLLQHAHLSRETSASTSATRWSGYLCRFLHQAFFRYLVYHTHHWQQATQNGKTTGLRQFRRFFSAHQRKLLERSSIAEHGLILERLSQAKPLQVVEGRISPPERGVIDLVPWVLGYANCRQRGRLQKFGLVVHFKKQEKLPQNSRRYKPYLRSGQIRRQTRTNAFQLYRLLKTPHPVVPFIVGIDAASLELNTPPEIFAPAFRFLRELPIELRHNPSRARFPDHLAVQALVADRQIGMTYHVGEDFRHLLSGLRAIHEVIEFLNPRPGDRLGHAIALALNPDTWASQISYQALVPKLEWLDDLVWLLHLLGPGHNLVGELEVEDTIQRLGREIYCSRRSAGPELHLLPPTLYDAWRLRQLDPYSIDIQDLTDGHASIVRRFQHGDQGRRWAKIQNRVLTDVNRHIGSNTAFRLLGRYWYDRTVRSTGDEIEPIDMQDRWKLWRRVCREAQAKIQKLVQDRQLVVEVNPTINRVIGPMGRLAEHHIFRMTLDEKHHLRPGIRVTVNTDDPGVVGTSLMHEYYLLGENLLKNDVPETRVEEWLEWLRKNGSDFSFLSVLPDSPEDPRHEHLSTLLDRLQRMYPNLARRVQGQPSRYHVKPTPRQPSTKPPTTRHLRRNAD